MKASLNSPMSLGKNLLRIITLGLITAIACLAQTSSFGQAAQGIATEMNRHCQMAWHHPVHHLRARPNGRRWTWRRDVRQDHWPCHRLGVRSVRDADRELDPSPLTTWFLLRGP